MKKTLAGGIKSDDRYVWHLGSFVNCNLLSKFIACAISISTLHSSVVAANQPLDSAKIIYLLRQTKVVKPERSLNVALSQRQAIVLTDMTEKETENDLKIDAVLIAREIITGFPEDISRVRVTFQKPGSNRANQIDVTAGDVRAYGSGAMDAKALLNSLDVNEVDYNVNDAPGAGNRNRLNVAPGPLLDKRLLLLSRIEALKTKGTNVKAFMDRFAVIETMTAKGSEEEVGQAVSDLADKLKEQEEFVKESHLLPTPVVSKGGEGGGGGGFLSGPERQELHQRMQAMAANIQKWRLQGRNVNNVIIQLNRIRTLFRDPQTQSQARAAMDQLEHETP